MNSLENKLKDLKKALQKLDKKKCECHSVSKSEEISYLDNGQWSLEKSVNGVRYSGLNENHAPFMHGSVIKIKRAVSDKSTGKTHGYEIHEHRPDGVVQIHRNVNYHPLDSAMEYNGQKARLRMGSENNSNEHDLHREAKVEIHKVPGKKSHFMVLKPHDDAFRNASESSPSTVQERKAA